MNSKSNYFIFRQTWLKLSIVSRYFTFIFIALCFFAGASDSRAQTTGNLVTFAQFIERNGAQDFRFKTISTREAVFETISGGSEIYFRYQNIQNLPPALQDFQEAKLYLSVRTGSTATSPGGVVIQPFDQLGEIRIVRDTPAPVGGGNRTNLLTITINAIGSASPILTGTSGGNSATFSATTPDHIVTFTSDFLGFNQTTQRNLGLSFSSVVNNLSLNSPTVNNFVKEFTAAGSGTFASNPPPVVLTPTAAEAAVSGQVRTSGGIGVAGAQISIIDPQGRIRTVRADSNGNYRIGELETGHAYILHARAKGMEFESRVVFLTDDVFGIDFIALE